MTYTRRIVKFHHPRSSRFLELTSRFRVLLNGRRASAVHVTLAINGATRHHLREAAQ